MKNYILCIFLLATQILGQVYYGLNSYGQPLYGNNPAQLYTNNNTQTNLEQGKNKILFYNKNSDVANAVVTPEPFDHHNYPVPLLSRSQIPQDSRNFLHDRVMFDEKKNTELIKSQIGATKPPNDRAQSALEDAIKVLSAKTVPAAKIAADITNFGLQLMRNVDQVGNAVISPGSVAASLALLQQGARGETQFQISIALDMSGAESSAAYRQITAVLKARKSKNVLKLANGIFTAASFTLNPFFGKLATQNFGAEVKTVDFNRPEQAVQQINRWIEDNTERQVKELVTQESVTYHSQMVLANAIYFKGVWQTLFNPKSTIPMDFHLPNGQVKQTPFMRLITKFKAGLDQDIGAQYVVIPFDSEKYSFVMLLPKTDTDVNSVLRRLDAKRLTGYQNTELKEVKLSIPKFTLRRDTNLRPVLSKMGILNIFNYQSDLSGITEPGMVSPQISAAVHTALLSIDEEGSTAAAATAFAAVALSSTDDTEYFRADRPFLGVLWDNEINIPLFITRVEDPTSMT